MRFLYISMALLALGLQPAFAQETPADAKHTSEAFDQKRFHEEVVTKKDLPNFHQVYPYLYRSGEPTKSGMQQIQSNKISTIIDLRAPSERKWDEPSEAQRLGLKYINLPMSSAPPTKKQVETVLHEVEEAKSHPEKGAVLIHCAHGSDRTGCMVGIWRVTHDNWTYEDAYKEMRKYWFTPKFTKLSEAVRQRAQTH